MPSTRKTPAAVAALLVAALLPGCSIAGSWKRIATDPPGAPFPADRVAFDDHDNYTATWHHDDLTRTSTGKYEYNGSTLKILNPNAEPRVYNARFRMDGKLELTYAESGQSVTAILERTDR